MRTIFYAAALLGASASAIHINNDYMVNEFAQISETKTNSLADASANAAVITDANCETLENGIVIRSSTPECQLVKKPSADA